MSGMLVIGRITSFTYKGKAVKVARARVFYERALALDPGNVDALTLFALTDTIVAIAYDSDDRRARLAAAEAALAGALSIATGHAFAHLEMGLVQISTIRSLRAFQNARSAALDRNLALAHGVIGLAKVFIGHGEETEAHVEEAIRLSPRDTFLAYIWLGAPGQAKLSLGADEEAIAWLRRSIDANQSFPNAHLYLAAALARLGRLDERGPRLRQD